MRPKAVQASAAAFLVACLGIALFSVMDGVMKGLAIALGAYNAMLWRQVAGLGMSGAAFIAAQSALPARPVLKLHFVRGVIAGLMAFTFFWGIARVPLAEGIALSFIAPLVTLYLAAVLLAEKISRHSIFASMLGIVGVCVIVAGRIGGADHDREALLGMGSIVISALLYAYNLILQRRQALLASPLEVAFFVNAFALATLLTAAPWLAIVPDAGHWPAIGGAALLAFLSTMLLSWAYARAEAQVLVPVEYTAFIWAAIVGYIFFEEPVTPATLAGAGLIVIGCLIAARQRPEHIEVAAV